MKLTNILLISYTLVLIILGCAVVRLNDLDEERALESQSHIIEQPEKQVIYLVNESAVFEHDGYLYVELDGDYRGR
jgi:hypothetical protein